MNSVEDRVLKLEAQMNAMAQAWLYLASTVEMEFGADLATMEAALCWKRWPSAPEIDQAARDTVRWLCGELAAARAVRAARLRDQGERRW